MPKVSDEKLEQRRREILIAAVACFARDGFHKTTMSAIAEMAGVSTGLAYRYFRGKDDILRAAVREVSVSSDPTPLEAADLDDPGTLLDLVIRISYQRFALPDREERLRLRFRAWAEALDDDDIRSDIVGRWKTVDDIAVGLVTRAQERGEIAAGLDPRAVARVMFALDDGLDLQWMLDPDTDLKGCRDVQEALFGGWFASRAAGRSQDDADGSSGPGRVARGRTA